MAPMKGLMLSPAACLLAISALAKNQKTSIPKKRQEISLLHYGATDEGSAKSDLLEELDAIHRSGKEVVQVGLMEELAEKVELSDDRLAKLAHELQPMFAVLPKNSWGKLDHSVVRYALHRLLVQRHGWYIQGLEPDGAARNDTSQARLKKWVPDFLQAVLERRMGESGYTLQDVVALAATFERLVQNEASQRLEGIYKIMNVDVDDEIDSEDVDDIVDMYLTAYLRGGNISASSPEQALMRLSIFRQKYTDWKDVKGWVNGLVNNASAITIPADFEQLLEVAEIIGENFASYTNIECRDLKRSLLDIEDQRLGRVNISAFYKMGLHSHWKFTEKVDYLKALGALDDSDPANPAVIVSNYIMSRPNCLDTSHFYSICCRNECDALLASIERDIEGPLATPEKLVELVSRLASDTITAPRHLPSTLVNRLHQVAATHGGRVPLHGRLFAQWMHHAFPRECPYPHEAGTISPQTADEWMHANGQESAQASEEEMICHVNGDCGYASSSNGGTSGATDLPWTDNEELLIELVPQARANTASSESSMVGIVYRINQCLRSMALMSVAAGLAIASKILVEKPAEDPNLKLRKRAQAGLGKSLAFLILPIFVLMFDCSVGAYSSSDLLLGILCLGLAALIVFKRNAVAGITQDTSFSTIVV